MARPGLPHFAAGLVIKGFARGSKELGIPTANFGKEVVDHLPAAVTTGVYYGWAALDNGPVHKMVMSIGWNPYYKNKQKSMETHIMHKFAGDFYGQMLRVCIVGYLRPETNFNTLDELIAAIQKDISDAERALDEADMKKYRNDSFFSATNGVQH